jgi:hypothetical protein
VKSQLIRRAIHRRRGRRVAPRHASHGALDTRGNGIYILCVYTTTSDAAQIAVQAGGTGA